MMTSLFKYTLLIFLLSFAACSSDDDAASTVLNEQPQPGDVLELTVSAADFVKYGAPDTRATDNGKETTFEDGDRVGIIVLGEGNTLIYDNIPYVYNNGNWTFDSNNDDGKGGCYYDSKATTFIVYYPYSRAADRVTGVNDLKARFAPQFNQSDIEDYRSSDLMMWSSNSLTFPVKELNAKLTHAFASVYLTLKAGKYVLEDGIVYTGSYTPGASDISDISDVSLTIDNTVYIPFQGTDGTLRCIIPTNITLGDIRCFYTIGSNTYGNSIKIVDEAVAVNTRYACTPVVELIYGLDNVHVGDFYCKKEDGSGYVVPSDVESLTAKQISECLGIVIYAGHHWSDNANYLETGIGQQKCHGYAMALLDAEKGHWAFNSWDKRFQRVGTYTATSDWNGYENMKIMRMFVEQYGENISYYNFPAANRCITFGVSQYPKFAAPDNSSDWYLPSIGQLDYLNKNTSSIRPSFNKLSAAGKYTQWFKLAESGGVYSYWSSTEYTEKEALMFYFSNGSIYRQDKNYNFYVRPICAF